MNAGMQGHGTEGSHTGVYGNTRTEASGRARKDLRAAKELLR